MKNLKFGRFNVTAFDLIMILTINKTNMARNMSTFFRTFLRIETVFIVV